MQSWTSRWLKTLQKKYLSYQVNTLNIDNALVFQILSLMLTDMDAYFYVKLRKAKQDSWVLYFHVNKDFLGPDHVAGQAVEAEAEAEAEVKAKAKAEAEAEGKLKNSH